MRIQHNIAALNASNRLKANDSAISSNIAKLSSGYRINSAADDAAGLAVSEKMRSQINGLNQAQDNAENGISLVQTAEGGLNESESILQRMNTLAVESANGTYQDSTDRANLQKEVTALKSELDRISTSTNFNQINLLDGSLGGDTGVTSVADFSSIPTGALGTVTAATNETDSFTAISPAGAGTVSYTVNYNDADGNAKSLVVSYAATTGDDETSVGTAIASKLQGSDLSNLFDIADDGSGAVTFTAKTAGAGKGQITGVLASESGVTQAVAQTTAGSSSAAEVDTITNSITGNAGDVVKYTVNYTDATGAAKTAQVSYTIATGDDTDDIASGINTALSNLTDFKAGGTFTTAEGTSKITVTAAANGALNKITGVTAEVDSAQSSTAFAQTVKGTDAYQALDTTKFNSTDSNSNTFSVDGHKFAFVASEAAGAALASDVTYVVTAGVPDAAATTSMASHIQQQTGLTATAAGTSISIYGDAKSKSTDGVTFQIGSDNKADQRVSLSIGDMSSSGLGVSGVDISTQASAEAAIDTIKTAVNTVSATRADLGALQNRLEHTTNNLSTMSENLTSAESQIRDVDMSDEYVQYSKNQILSQAATSMLAQANVQPQNVLTLLKG